MREGVKTLTLSTWTIPTVTAGTATTSPLTASRSLRQATELILLSASQTAATTSHVTVDRGKER